MHPQTSSAEHAEITRRLERYADPHRPPSRWGYVVAGVSAGTAIALVGVLPPPWIAPLVIVMAVAGLGYDRWLLRHHGVPKLRDLPVAVRREQMVLVVVGVLILMLPFLLTEVLTGLTLTARAAIAGVGVALLLGIGGPVVDHRARARAAALLGERPSEGSGPRT